MNLDKWGLTSYFKEDSKLYIGQGLYLRRNKKVKHITTHKAKQEAKKKCKYIKISTVIKKIKGVNSGI